jgi:hypothetical protein
VFASSGYTENHGFLEAKKFAITDFNIQNSYFAKLFKFQYLSNIEITNLKISDISKPDFPQAS